MTAEDARSLVERFKDSMTIDYEKWHDGIGYDLELLARMSAEEKAEIEAILVPRAREDWRDVEALAALGTPKAKAALKHAASTGSPEIQLAVNREAPDVVDVGDRVKAIVQAIEHSGIYDGLSKAIDQAATFHPPPIEFALKRALLTRDGEAACLIAGLLFFIHGKAKSTFDWSHRPFFLRFNTENQEERRAAYHELCATLDIPPLPGT